MKESIKISNTIKRKVDELGRMVIPIEIRELLNIKENDYLEKSKKIIKLCILHIT